MINHIRFQTGYATKLPNIGHNPYTFTPGINVLFGPNGCGKSTVLKTIAAYCAIKETGWSSYTDPLSLPNDSRDFFPSNYSTLAPGNCIADVGWDGTPTLFNAGDIASDETWFYKNVGKNKDNVFSESEQMLAMINKPSSGEYRAYQINKILNMIATNAPQTILGNPATSPGEASYINSLPRNGKRTILFDEPERSLSLPKQLALFNALDAFTENYQLIISTHSPLILFKSNINIIDVEPGYANECMKILAELFGQI
jgi:predicted ATPase